MLLKIGGIHSISSEFYDSAFSFVILFIIVIIIIILSCEGLGIVPIP